MTVFLTRVGALVLTAMMSVNVFGGGPACATLYLPRQLSLPETVAFRYSTTRDAVRARREKIPETLHVDQDFFAGKPRG